MVLDLIKDGLLKSFGLRLRYVDRKAHDTDEEALQEPVVADELLLPARSPSSLGATP